MKIYVSKQDGIIHANVPEHPTSESVGLFIDQYNELVNKETRALIILNLLSLQDYPDTDTKLVIFKRMKELRQLRTDEKKAIIVEKLAHKLAMQSILFVSGHNQQIKYFDAISDAIEWLNAPGF